MNRRLIVSIGGIVAALVVLVSLYIMVVRPQVKKWNDVRVELKKNKKKLTELRKAFGDQEDPRVELATLRQELKNVGRANNALKKIKKPGLESDDLPKELKDPDPKIKIALVNDYLKEVMSVSEENIRTDLKDAGIDAPNFKLYTHLKYFPEAAYYMNRANGLQGVINAIVKTKTATDSEITFNQLGLEGYARGIKRRESSRNVLSYSMQMTMDMQSLMVFMYNLQEEDGYYFVSSMNVRPAVSRRFSTQKTNSLKLLVDARINTVMIYKSRVIEDLKKAVASSSDAKKRTLQSGGKVTGFLALARGMTATAEKEAGGQEKKWWEFWK